MGFSDFLKIKKGTKNKPSDKSSNEWGNKETSVTTEDKAPVAKTPTPLPTEYDDLDYNQTRALYEFKPATLTGGYFI